MKEIRIVSYVLAIILMLGFRPSGRHSFAIRFRNQVGDRPLRLFEGNYVDQFGEPFTIQQFKYYISAIRVTGEGVEELLLDKPHLVDEGDSSSLVVRLWTSVSHIHSVCFIVGVDSVENSKGVQTGDLDPQFGMFWTWNTGYIYARMEGLSDSAHSPAHRFTWDIGGYQWPSNAIRKITLALPVQNDPTKADTACITADLLKWFDGKQPVRIARSPVCHQPGALAMQLADNYSTMFSIGH